MRFLRSALILVPVAAAATGVMLRPAAADDGAAGGDGAAAAKEDAPKAEVGSMAPDFTLKDHEGKDVALSSFRGSKVVVVAFYPKAFTPGCTKEMKCLIPTPREAAISGVRRC